jgi:plastocyanin
MKIRFLLLCLAFANCSFGAARASTPADNQIVVKDFSYSPMTLTIPAETTVTWRNLDGEPHLVLSMEGKFRSPVLDQNDSFSFKFEKPGTYNYICSIHPQMKGTVIVK